MSIPTLIAIGGGGATHGTHPELDHLCLEFARARPRIGYVGAASGDDPEKTRTVHASLAPLAGAVLPLPPGADLAAARAWADGLDLVYVGGGDPVRLVRYLGETGIASVLARAHAQGVPLVGVSAGAMCWFDRFLWRAGADGLQIAPGLGLVPGTMTPHSLIEPDRLTRLQALVAQGALAEAYAVDDGAALILRGDAPPRGFPHRGPPFVHRISQTGRVTLSDA